MSNKITPEMREKVLALPFKTGDWVYCFQPMGFFTFGDCLDAAKARLVDSSHGADCSEIDRGYIHAIPGLVIVEHDEIDLPAINLFACIGPLPRNFKIKED